MIVDTSTAIFGVFYSRLVVVYSKASDVKNQNYSASKACWREYLLAIGKKRRDQCSLQVYFYPYE